MPLKLSLRVRDIRIVLILEAQREPIALVAWDYRDPSNEKRIYVASSYPSQHGGIFYQISRVCGKGK